MINYCYLPQAGQGWANSVWGKPPAFVCVLGFTATALLEGISSAGLTPSARQYTAIADAEVLATGKAQHFPLPQLVGGVSPAFISRAMVVGLSLPLYIFNAGLIHTLPIPHIDLQGQPAQCVSTGRALPREVVEQLFSQGLAWGEKLSKAYPYLVLSECVVAGTTTALAVLQGLGIPAAGWVGSSHPICNHQQKRLLVAQGLAQLPPHPDPITLVSGVGDPMQIVIAGMAIAGSRYTQIMLAGGSQMLAVYALARALTNHYQLPWQKQNLVIGTTKWVWHDPTSDLPALAHAIGDIPILVSTVNFHRSSLAQLRIYEAGYVKEGVGAGASMICAHLYRQWTEVEIIPAIEQLL